MAQCNRPQNTQTPPTWISGHSDRNIQVSNPHTCTSVLTWPTLRIHYSAESESVSRPPSSGLLSLCLFFNLHKLLSKGVASPRWTGGIFIEKRASLKLNLNAYKKRDSIGGNSPLLQCRRPIERPIHRWRLENFNDLAAHRLQFAF